MDDSDVELAALLTRAEAVRATRYPRRSAYCGGSDPVPDGVAAGPLAAWLAECLDYARRACGPESPLAARMAEWMERETSLEVLEGALADLRAALGRR